MHDELLASCDPKLTLADSVSGMSLITCAVATSTLMPPPAWLLLPSSAASALAAASGNALPKKSATCELETMSFGESESPRMCHSPGMHQSKVQVGVLEQSTHHRVPKLQSHPLGSGKGLLWHVRLNLRHIHRLPSCTLVVSMVAPVLRDIKCRF
jgi:hypothetical protein